MDQKRTLLIPFLGVAVLLIVCGLLSVSKNIEKPDNFDLEDEDAAICREGEEWGILIGGPVSEGEVKPMEESISEMGNEWRNLTGGPMPEDEIKPIVDDHIVDDSRNTGDDQCEERSTIP